MVHRIDYGCYRSDGQYCPVGVLSITQEAKASHIDGYCTCHGYILADIPSNHLAVYAHCSGYREIDDDIHRHTYGGECRLFVELGVLALRWAVPPLVHHRYGDRGVTE